MKSDIFYFQAEDGIRNMGVTGVQTCALPILVAQPLLLGAGRHEVHRCEQQGEDEQSHMRRGTLPGAPRRAASSPDTSEERRGGKECRSRWSPDHQKKTDILLLLSLVCPSVLG